MNTKEDAKIMSWWDYGYQISSMANRTILVDNNTWNNTHISRVGQAMASNEEHTYAIMRELDVDYVLVIFGGLISYSSDGEHNRCILILPPFGKQRHLTMPVSNGFFCLIYQICRFFLVHFTKKKKPGRKKNLFFSKTQPNFCKTCNFSENWDFFD